MKVIFRFYDKNLFEQDLAKCLDKATNNYCKFQLILKNLNFLKK